MELSRKRIPHPRLSLEWIEEYLSRRGLTPESFLELAKTMSQDKLSGVYHIQKKDVGKMLRILGFDTEAVRYRKIVSTRAETEKAKAENFKEQIPNGMREHVETYGWQDARKKYGKELVRKFRFAFPEVSAPHASVVKFNILEREVRENRDAVVALMEQGLHPQSISRHLGLNHDHLLRLILSINPNYSGEKRLPEELEETQAKINEAIAAKKVAKQKLIDEILARQTRAICEKRIVELLGLGIVPTDRNILDRYPLSPLPRGSIQNLYKNRFDIDLEALKPVFRVMLSGLKRIPDYTPSELLAKSEGFCSVDVPSYLRDYEDLYRASIVSQDPLFVQSFVTTNRITSCSELVREHFPFLHFQSYLEGFCVDSKITFYERSPEDLIEERFGMTVGEVERSLKETVPKITGLGELYGNYPDVLAQHIHHAIGHFSIELPPLKLSEPEVVVKRILDEINEDYELHNRTVLSGGKELDFYYPALRLAIEVNPTHTHNSTYGFQKKCKPLDPSYHLQKSKEAKNAGITLIHLYDDDLSDQKKLKSFLEQKINGYREVHYGRTVSLELAISSAEKSSARDFIANNHRQGNTPAKVYYRFFSKAGELIGAASFSPTKSHGADWELKRLCFAPHIQIRFGISKLVARFSADYPEAKKLLSYSNIDYGYSESYEKAGFSLLGETGPSLRWVNPIDPDDSYSWSIATPWSAKSGVIAKALGSRECDGEEAKRIVEEELPHRTDAQRGYVKLYKAGSKILVHDLSFR